MPDMLLKVELNQTQITVLHDLRTFLAARLAEMRAAYRLRSLRLCKPTPAQLEQQQRYANRHRLAVDRLARHLDTLAVVLRLPAEGAPWPSAEVA